MNTDSTIAKSVRAADINAAYDAACKRLLSEKIILAWIMKSCVEEYRDCSVEEIAEKYIEGQPQVGETAVAPDETNPSSRIHGAGNEDATVTEGTVTYDIRFLAAAPVSGELIRLIINIEAQNDFYPGYPLIKRRIYYCSRMISAQYGAEFTESHYEDVKKVYSIWLCLNPPKNRENTITSYSIMERNLVGNVKEKKANYDLMTAIMICLGNREETAVDILKLLNVLLSSKTAAGDKCQILEDSFNIRMTQTLEREVSLMCNLSKGVREEGIQEGLQKGIQKGRQEGIQVLVSTLRKLHLPSETILEEVCTQFGLTKDQAACYLTSKK